MGTVCALLANVYGGWTVGAGLLGLTLLVGVGYVQESRKEPAITGLTTEIALLLMFLVGAFLASGQRAAAIIVGGGVAVLLHFKGELHGVVAQLNAADLKAIMQFALLSLVILPILPDRAFGPYDVLNPRRVWFMVTLIVGINLSGYIIYKFFGVNAGVLLGGILGGVISSTATTVSYARRTALAPTQSGLAALVILIAGAVVFVRLALEVAFVAPAFVMAAAPPLLLMALVLTLAVGLLWRREKRNGEEATLPEQGNPTELKGAIFFGLLYAAVLFASAAAKDKFGNQGLYAVAALSGLTDVDAITLSTSQLVTDQRLTPHDGWQIILVATMSNLCFKLAAVAALGPRLLLRKVGVIVGLAFLCGVLLLAFL
jgi:uncharacterized membrane protein (DUF4010 family)